MLFLREAIPSDQKMVTSIRVHRGVVTASLNLAFPKLAVRASGMARELGPQGIHCGASDMCLRAATHGAHMFWFSIWRGLI